MRHDIDNDNDDNVQNVGQGFLPPLDYVLAQKIGFNCYNFSNKKKISLYYRKLFCGLGNPWLT